MSVVKFSLEDFGKENVLIDQSGETSKIRGGGNVRLSYCPTTQPDTCQEDTSDERECDQCFEL